MGYNKAREEKKWLKWKAAEEAQMREAGVDEKVIALLHTYDWAQFNADRRYYEHQADINGPVVQNPVKRSARSGGTARPFQIKRRETPLRKSWVT